MSEQSSRVSWDKVKPIQERKQIYRFWLHRQILHPDRREKPVLGEECGAMHLTYVTFLLFLMRAVGVLSTGAAIPHHSQSKVSGFVMYCVCSPIRRIGHKVG